MRRHYPYGAVLLTVLLEGCGAAPEPPIPAAVPSPTSEGIDYASWPAVTPLPFRVPEHAFFYCRRPSPDSERRLRESGPHFVPAIKVYANPTALAVLRSGVPGPLPVGSAVVKEKWWNERAERPEAYAAMVKREAGYDPDHGDWEYVFVQLDGKGEVQRGRIASCVGCHRSAAAKDYLFRTYLNFDTVAKE